MRPAVPSKSEMNSNLRFVFLPKNPSICVKNGKICSLKSVAQNFYRNVLVLLIYQVFHIYRAQNVYKDYMT